MMMTIENINRISRIQEKRLITAGILSAFSALYLCVICMSLYISIPMWLVVINIACLMFNVPLILWLMELYVAQRKKMNNSIK